MAVLDHSSHTINNQKGGCFSNAFIYIIILKFTVFICLDNNEQETSQSPTKKTFIPEFLKVSVIIEQPLIKIKSTSLMHGAIMLFEGEQ